MAITYRSGNLMTGLTSDPKPTLAVDKAVFFDIEKRIYFDFNLSTTNWRQRSAGASIGSIISLAG